jgi:hypothetical protein
MMNADGFAGFSRRQQRIGTRGTLPVPGACFLSEGGAAYQSPIRPAMPKPAIAITIERLKRATNICEGWQRGSARSR